MPRPLLAAAALTLVAAACAPPASRPGPTAPTAPAPSPTAPAPAPTRASAPRLPSVGCDPAFPLAPGFRADEAALDEAAGTTAPTGPTTELVDGYLRLALPAAWFPARIDGPTFTAYQVRTGAEDDAFVLYLGDAPPFRPHPGREFRVALGSVLVRGTLWDEGPRHRMEALALLPCASPRYVQFSAHTDSPERLAAFIGVLRSLRAEREAGPGLREVLVNATRDASALSTLTSRDPLGRELVTRALAGEGLRAPYPLSTNHPLADQILAGRFQTELGGVPTQVWVRIPVSAGRTTAPAVFRAVTDGTLARESAALSRAGCRAPSLVVAHDGVGLSCEGEPEFRSAVPDETSPTALPRALAQLLHARATLSRWRQDATVAGSWPASLCETDRVRVVPEAGALYLTLDRCVLAVDPARQAILSASIEGECEQVPSAPWSAPLRTAGRFDEVRGPEGRGCRFSLGWNGRSAFVLAAGDAGSASAPIASGPAVAVERRAVHTAVVFLQDLVRYATEETSELPPNVHPTVLRGLGVDRPGTPAAAATLRLLHARGGFSGAALSAVLGARTLDATHVEVSFMPLVVTVTRESAGWVVTGVRPATR